MSARPIIACIGDSLTVGEHADGFPLHNHPWPALLDVALFPNAGVGQFGLGGDTLVPSSGNPGMNTRWAADVQGAGFKGRTLWGGVNDTIGDVAGATSATNAQAILVQMMAEGPTMFVFTPGFGAYSGWSAPREAQLQIFRTAMFAFAAANPALLTLDLYAADPLGLGDPSDLKSMLLKYRYSDGLHINPDPGATRVRDLMLAKWAPLFPPAPVIVTSLLQANALTTIANACDELSLTSDNGGPIDQRVARWINTISNAIEGYLGRKGLMQRQTGFVERLPGFGRERLQLSLTPVESVASIAFGYPTAQETLDTNLWYLDDPKAGIIYNENGFTNTGLIIKAIEPYLEPGSEERLYVVTYTGGFIMPNDPNFALPPAGQTPLPAEISQACLIGVTQLARGKGADRNLTGERVLNAQQLWKEGRKLITEEMVDLLQNWYRPL